MKLSLAEKLLEIHEALKLLGGTGREDALNEDHILFQRGNNDMSAKQVTSDILQTNVRGELYETYSTMTKKEDKTTMFNKLIHDLLKLGHVFVIFHDGRYYEINMSIDQVHNHVRSEKVAQLFRDRKSLEKKYISAFVALEKYLKRKIGYVSNLAVDKEIKKIYKAFLNVVKTKDQTSKEEKIQEFYESHKQTLAVFDAVLTLCTDNHFVNLPQKILVANPMQSESNEGMDEDEDEYEDEDEDEDNCGLESISNEGDSRLAAGSVRNNEEAAVGEADLVAVGGNDPKNDDDHVVLERLSQLWEAENNMIVDQGTSMEAFQAAEFPVRGAYEAVDHWGLESAAAGVFHAISNEGDSRLATSSVRTNEEADESARFTFDLSYLNGNDGENRSTSDRGMDDTDLDRIIASDNADNENSMVVDNEVNYEFQRAIESAVHHDEFMEWVYSQDDSSIDISNLQGTETLLSEDEMLTVFE